MAVRKDYSLQDFETLRKSATVLRASETGTYSLGDAVLLSAAADLLGTSIPELPQALAQIGLYSGTSAAEKGSVRSPAKASQPPSGSSAPGPHLASPAPASSPPALPSIVNPPSGDDASFSAFLEPSLGPPSGLAGLDQHELGQYVFNEFDREVVNSVDHDEYTGDNAKALVGDFLHLGLWVPFDCDQQWTSLIHDAGSHGSLSNAAAICTAEAPQLPADLDSPLLGIDAASWLASSPTENSSIHRSPPIAPKPAHYKTSPADTREKTPAVRGPIQDARVRKAISEVRQRRACVRCRMQKLKCSPDPQNPFGPCLTCTSTAHSIYQLPCLRYKIPDTPLFRYAMYNSTFYIDHPLVGDKYGDFYLPRTWASSRTKTLSALHHGGLRLEVEVREFIPPADEDTTDDRSMHGAAARPMYAIPWAVADPDIETRKLEPVIDKYIEPYIVNLLKPNDNLVWPIYQEALRVMRNDPTNCLIHNTMRLWTGARLADRGWRCFGSDNFGAEKLSNQLRPPGWTPLPPYIDYQIVSIIMQRFLAPLRKRVLGNLQKLIKDNKPSNWYSIFLASFILLHSCEMTVVIIRKHAAKRRSPLRYLIMELVRASNTAAKVILAHFHYCCRGEVPFSRGFDWLSPVHKRMADLDAEQSDFIRKVVKAVHEREHIFKAVRDTDQYEAPYWFVSQLFENDWQPRESHEHSPASDEAYITGKDHLTAENGTIIPLDPFLRPDIEEDVAKRPNRQPTNMPLSVT